jgi:hypothetical protein
LNQLSVSKVNNYIDTELRKEARGGKRKPVVEDDEEEENKNKDSGIVAVVEQEVND